MNYKIDIKLDGLGVILIVNIILKFFNLISWEWPLVLWPLWVLLVIIAIVLIVFFINKKRRKW